MDKFASIEAFVTTIEENGFSAAARKLGLATSSVTRLVNNLEGDLGTTLVNRSTRRVTLTAAGEAFYSDSKTVLRDLRHAESVVRDLNTEVRGRLKISIPVALGRLRLIPILEAFMEECPAVQLDVDFNDDHVDMLEEDLDISIRIGQLPETGRLVATRLLDQRRCVIAAPHYLERYGTPLAPDELHAHYTLIYDYRTGHDVWRFAKPDNLSQIIEIKLSGRMRTNNSEALLSAAKRGIGLALLPDWLVESELATGSVVRVLDEYVINPDGMQPAIYLLYPENRRSMKRVRAFVDFVKDQLALEVVES